MINEDESKIQQFGKNTPLTRAAQPVELAGAYVYLAYSDTSYVTGEIIHVNGGKFVSG